MPTRDEVWPNGTPCWVDVSVDDPAAAREFYGALFGWDTQEGPPETGGYTMCLLHGRPAAAITPKMPGSQGPNVWSTYLATDDVDKTVAAAKAAGGVFLFEPDDVLTFGRMAYGADPTGAPYGLWQGRDHTGAGIYNEPGTYVWNELMTRDYAAAQKFYADVFGYTYDEVGDEIGDEGFTYSTVKRASDEAIVGGMGALGDDVPAEQAASWGVYFMVEDCAASVARVVELGGSVVKEPFDTPFGPMASVRGPQGEGFSVMSAPAGEDSAQEGGTEG